MSIQVLGDPWNPTTGCTKISAGCRGCYAETMALRLQGMKQPRYRNGFKLTLHPDLIDRPREEKKARTYFVNSMSDLFHKDIPLDFIKSVFKTMNECPQHTFQILTKRGDILFQHAPHLTWTPNIWMGVSIEDQRVIDRIDHLRQVPAAIRFLSVEPLIGPLPDLNLDGIHWVLLGGESGPSWRTMDVNWVRDIRDQCIKNNVPFFFKQYAGKNPEKLGRILDGKEWSQSPVINSKSTKIIMPQRVLLPPKPIVRFTPKRVFVNVNCIGLDQTEDYLERIRRANPNVEIEEYEGKFKYPADMIPAEMFHYMKDTILISERSDAPFFETFPSPGNCVENLNTMAKPSWQCVGKCHYCYLMLTEPHEHYFYTNLDRFEDELAHIPFCSPNHSYIVDTGISNSKKSLSKSSIPPSQYSRGYKKRSRCYGCAI